MNFLQSFIFLIASTTAVADNRITNGNTADVGQFPYQVGLSMHISSTTTAWCGGSLIGPRWILTAAHCTHGIQSVTVYLGATLRTSAEVTYTVYNNNIIIHSNYKPTILRDDISLIRIPTVTYGIRIQPIKLPSMLNTNNQSLYAGETVIATGWGRISDDIDSVTDELQWTRLEVVANDVCSRTYGAVVYPTNICVGSMTLGSSTCNGDSGGPLVLEMTATQIGLVSFGAAAGCAKGYPVAFTRLSSYLKWIEMNSNISY